MSYATTSSFSFDSPSIALSMDASISAVTATGATTSSAPAGRSVSFESVTTTRTASLELSKTVFNSGCSVSSVFSVSSIASVASVFSVFLTFSVSPVPSESDDCLYCPLTLLSVSDRSAAFESLSSSDTFSSCPAFFVSFNISVEISVKTSVVSTLVALVMVTSDVSNAKHNRNAITFFTLAANFIESSLLLPFDLLFSLPKISSTVFI